VLYRNAYKNTVLWNVGEFFARVFAQAKLSNALLIYTSDHGQDLHERGNRGSIRIAAVIRWRRKGWCRWW
jgi:glucan phosphoethanolaminetransferase (alkaline phosphatase superfamily)